MAETHSKVQLHEKLQRYINRLIDRGGRAEDVVEAALTVAIASLSTLHGPRRASNALLSTAAGLRLLADQHEADVAASRH